MKKYLFSYLLLSFSHAIMGNQTVRLITEGNMVDAQHISALKKDIGTVIEKYMTSKEPVHVEISPRFKNSRTLLDEMYTGINGFNVDSDDTAKVTEAGGNPTYGEVKPEAIDELKKELKLTHKDGVVDLGCGVGRLIMQCHLETPICKAVGVELSHGRVQNARGAQKRLQHHIRTKAHTLEPELHKNLTSKNRALEFRHGDITKVDWQFAHDLLAKDGRMVVWICSTCFSQELLNQLAQNFAKLAADIKKNMPEHNGDIVILTLKDFPKNDDFLHYFEHAKNHTLDMTWSNGVTVYQYNLKK